MADAPWWETNEMGDRLRRALRASPDLRDLTIETCLRKRSYMLREHAEADRGRLAEWGRPGMEAYRCPVCQRFHLGHP